jgi:hypothetical protein
VPWGTGVAMTDPRLADHEMGLELQLVELVEQRLRAEKQQRHDDVRALQREIDAVQLEFAATAERIGRGQAFGSPRLRLVDRATA